MKNKVIILSSILFILPSILFAGTSYYVDCSKGSNGNGSYSDPWNNVKSVNSKSFSSGDDVYFKVGTTCSTSTGSLEALNVNWSGTSSDWVTIGAYYGNNQFGLGGNSRPKLNGNAKIPSVDRGIISIIRSGSNAYVEVKDLEIYDSAYSGIVINKSNYVKAHNCYIHDTWVSAVMVARSANINVTNNICKDNSQNSNGYNKTNHGSIVVTGMESLDTHHVLVSGNVVSGGREGINIVKKAYGITVEKNVLYGQYKGASSPGVYIYIDGATNLIIRNNMVYTGKGHITGSGGVHLALEADRCTSYPDKYRNYIMSAEIYGNLIADQSDGIKLGMEQACYDIGVRFSNTKVYNNTIVASQRGLTLRNQASGGSGNTMKNNIIWNNASGKFVDGSPIPSSWSFSDNMFNGNPGSPWNNNYFNDDPNLEKQTGWLDIVPGAAKEEWFVSNNSLAIKNNIGALSGGSSGQQSVSNDSSPPPAPSNIKVVN